MKISEGIRKGSVGKHQIIGSYFDKNGGVCAIGALLSLSLGSATSFSTYFPNIYLAIEDDFPPRPGALGKYAKDLCEAIINRNDGGQSFQQIIEWLESIGQ